MRARALSSRLAQVYPLIGAIAVGATIMAGFMVKYFGFHTDITFSKKLRQNPEHTGASDLRVAGHNNKFGISILKEHAFTFGPFRYEPMEGALPSRTCIPRTWPMVAWV